MIAAIKKSLSLKVSLTLAVVTIPIMIAAAYVVASRQMRSLEEQTLREGKNAAMFGARMYATMLEDAIQNGYFIAPDVFDHDYQEITAYDFGDKPKYHTKYDSYTDRAALVFQDQFLENPIFLYAIGADKNGYVPTHNGIHQKPLTGNPAVDKAANLSKRLLNSPIELAAVSNTEPVLTQRYQAEGGGTMWDIAAPIVVQAKHWGGFRVGVSGEEIDRRKTALLVQLLIVFTMLGAATIGITFVMIKRSMKPLESLSTTADDISAGEGLDTPIVTATTDEIGQMGRSLDRLRESLSEALRRMGEEPGRNSL